MLAFTLKPGAIVEFIRRVSLLEEDNEEARVNILLDMADEGYMQNVVQSSKTPDEYAEDLKKHFNVLDIRNQEPSGD